MGRKLDLSGLTDDEAEHVLQVVQRDMRLRKKEEERLSELKQELDEEGSRCLLLSRQSRFNQRCCIRCCAPFTFLLNPKRQCRDCRYNVCKACRVYNKRDKAWLCSACQKSRLLKTQSLEWFYTNVRSRFKRFGSAKVLKTLYKKHLAEHGALTELTEGSAYEDSICNEGSVCGSDSAFYRQSEEHSMAETLSVALRVAGEAIDEAISKAEFDTTNQEKQNEAHYLREHRGELIEELAKTIVQKIISRRKSLAEMKPEYDPDWLLDRIPPCGSLNHQASLWVKTHITETDQMHFISQRSRSAFSLLDNDLPNLNCGVSENQEPLQGLKKEGGSSAMSTWRSVDRLDNAMLKSPDGNWIALQSAQLSRPSLLTKRKSLVYSALEKESGVVSAYEGMGSDNEGKSEPENPWGAALLEFQRKMADSNFNLQDSQDVTSCHSDETEPMIPSPPTGHRDSIDDLLSDSEVDLKPNKPLLALYKKRIPQEIRRPTSSCRTNIIDVNFNPEEPVEKNSEAAELEVGKVRRLRKTRRNKKEKVPASYLDNSLPDNQSQHASDDATPDTLTSEAATPEPSDLEGDATAGEANQTGQELPFKLQEQANEVSISRPSTREDELDGWRDGEEQRDERREGGRERDQEEEEMLWMVDTINNRGRTEDEKEEEEGTNESREGSERIKNQLFRLVSQSSLTYLSSTDDELDGMGQSEEDRETDVMEETKEQREKRMEALTFTLCELEKQVGANQFSSTEDELDRVGLRDGEKDTGEDGQKEELAAKLCRLASQVRATEFSSTDDELDSTGRGEEEEEDDEGTFWKMEAENAVQVAPLRDLVSLVSASQFSSTEDELDRVGEDELERNEEVSKGDAVLDRESAKDREQPWLMTTEKGEDVTTNDKGRESDSDMNMFDSEVGSEGDKVTDASNVEKDIKNKESSEGTATAETVSDTEKVDCAQQGKTEAEESEKKDYVEEELIEDKYGDERLAGEAGEVEVSTFLSDGGKEAEETQGLKIEAEAERMKERIEERISTGSGEAGVPQENILQCKREAERSEETDGEEKQVEEKMRGFREGMGRWDTAKSDEEDVEFDRIISSMLMMSVEEIQVDSSADMAKDRFGELGTNGRAKIGGETANREKTDVQSTRASKETEELGSRGDKMKPEIIVCEGERDDLERPGENVIEQNEREVRNQQEAVNRNAQQETEKEDQERPDLEEEHGLDMAISEKPEETDEAKWTHERMDVDQEEQEETSERMTVKEQMMKRQGDSAEGSEQRECERKETKDGNAGDEEQSAPSDQEDILSPEEIQNDRDMELNETIQFISALLLQRYSAVSLRSITTEVLKVLNATEELLQGAEGGDGAHRPCAPSLPPNTNPKKLDQQFSRLEENVYVAAGTVYSLEVELGDLEECARGISGTTSDSELSFLEEQVASAAAKVQQSELQISDISARIAALRSAGLNVDPQSRFNKARTIPVMPITLDSSRQLRRRLPAPPMKDDKDA